MRSRCDSPSTVADGEGARTAALERYLSCGARRTTAHSGDSPTRRRARSNNLEPLAHVELCVARASRSARRRHGPLPAEVMRNHGSPLATITSRSARPAFRTFTSIPGATRLRPLIGAIRLSHRHRIGSRQRCPPQLVCRRARTQLSSACGLTASTPWESLRCGCPTRPGPPSCAASFHRTTNTPRQRKSSSSYSLAHSISAVFRPTCA